MASVTKSSGFAYATPSAPSKTANRTSGYYYSERIPPSETLPNGYEYIETAQSAELHRAIAEILSPHIDTSTGVSRLLVETMSPYVDTSTGVSRLLVETLSPYVETKRRRPVTFLILD